MAVTKKKAASAVAAVAVAAAMALGGTFAWQSISQEALNEASDTVNPGGRLHDDFNGKNKDVYVENFAEDPIYARVKLEEYFEFVMNPGTEAETYAFVAGSREDLGDGAYGDVETYATHYFDRTNSTDEWWSWSTGGSTLYMPTFNKDKDSLAADVNGTYGSSGYDEDGSPVEHYFDYVDYSSLLGYDVDGYEVEGLGAGHTATAYYDADSDSLDNGGATGVEETHYVAETGVASLMSMQQWIDGGMVPGDYWVYDADGWVYWANAIEGGTATGLLLDAIEPAQSFDDSWYYAVNVVAQFVTADDLGDGTEGNPGFLADGLSDEARILLDAIGVDVSGETGGEWPVEPESPLQLTISADQSWYLPSSVSSTVNLTASAVYEGVAVDDVSGVAWSISGNTEAGTVLSAESGNDVTLTVAPNEKGNIVVYASFTYADDEQGINETVTEEIVVTNGPSVSTMWVYDNASNKFVSRATYAPGEESELSFTTYFFPNYTGTIQPKDDAYSGEAATALAKKYTYTLVDADGTETTMEGVEIKQSGADLTVSIASTVSDPIRIKCKLQDLMEMDFEIVVEEENEPVTLSVSVLERTGTDDVLNDGETLTLKVDGDYAADDLVWKEAGIGAACSYIVVTENDDGTATITHSNHASICSDIATVKVSLESDDSVYTEYSFGVSEGAE